MNITLRQIAAFHAVATTASFTRASAQLNITQSAASGLVKELETELGVRLFDRTTRTVELTEAGREFRESTGRILKSLDEACADIRDLAEARRGRIAIAAPPLLAATFLPPLLARFAKKYPDIAVSVADVPTAGIVSLTLAGGVDLGIGTIPEDVPGLGRVPLFADALMLFEPAGEGEASRPASWSRLRDRPLIGLTTGSGVRALTDRTLTNLALDATPVLAVEQMITAMALVGAGLGHAVLPAYAAGIAGTFGVAARPLTAPQVSREVAAIMPAGRSPSPAAVKFLDLVRAAEKPAAAAVATS